MLWDSTDAPGNDAAVYTWNGYAQHGRVRSVLGYVEQHAERLRATYAAWGHDLGEHRVNGTRLIDRFALRDGLSYWWMSPLVEQSPWKTPAIVDAIRLLAFDEILAAERPSAVRLVSANADLHESIRELCRRAEVSYTWDQRPASTRFGLRAVFRALPWSVQAVASLLRHAISRWPLRKSRPVWADGEQAVMLASYFIHLDQVSCERGHFHSRHWEDLPALLHANGRRTNWIQHYLVSAVVPDTGTANRWVAQFNARCGAEGAHAFLDSYLSLGVLLSVMGRLAQLTVRSWRLRGIAKVFDPAGSRCSFWPLFRRDWRSSVCGPAAVENLLWIALLDRALKDMPHQPLGLFLYENQSWERAFIHAWRKHGHGTLIGVPHSTWRFWDLRFITDPRTLSRAGNHPIPLADRIALNGPAAVKACRETGFPMETTAECEALRYGYLRRLPIRARRDTAGAGPVRVLVLTDFSAHVTEEMLRRLGAAAATLEGRACITVKPHPNHAVRVADYPAIDLAITNDPLEKILGDFDVAYTSDGTSAAADAFLAGLPVVVALPDSSLNFSPLRGYDGVSFVGSASELAAALLQAPTAESRETPETFFFLDPAFPRWRRLLGI